jgi:DNA-binding MarR family transcriptional regulator
MEKNLLKQKNLTALDKLFIMTVLEYDEYRIPCTLTSQDFATALGVTRKSILDVIAKLEEMDYIRCKVVAPTRHTKITDRLYNLLD